MADPDNNTTITVDSNNEPIALRRKRRNSAIQSPLKSSTKKPSNISTSTSTHGISTPPTTPLPPKKKKVRFSDPGPEISETGLTPFIKKTTLNTTNSNRRKTLPANLWNRANYEISTSPSKTVQFAPLRQVLDGRVKRRLARNGLSEEIIAIEYDKKRAARLRSEEIARLKRELEEKDEEMQGMRDEQDILSQLGGESGSQVTTNSVLSSKVQELEEEIMGLRSEHGDEEHDWSLMAKDPFDHQSVDADEEEGNDQLIGNCDDEDAFGGPSMFEDDEMDTTPTRLNTTSINPDTSFLSPPSTLPNTPCKPAELVSEAVQTSLPLHDSENEALKQQLEELKSEISNLTSALALKEDNQHRLTSKLSEYLPAISASSSTSSQPDPRAVLDSALDNVLTSLALAQSQSTESSSRFSALSNEIFSLSFEAADSSNDPSSILQEIDAQFCTTRLSLEYLFPGEQKEGFSPSTVLSLLISRIKTLLLQIKERDHEIDQYHEQEVLLRQQINTRVNALDEVKAQLSRMEVLVEELRQELGEKEVGEERLRSALEGYRNEVASLEALVGRMEKENGALKQNVKEGEEALLTEKLRHDTTTADLEGKTMLVDELSRRLSAALESSTALSTQLTTLTSEHQAQISELEGRQEADIASKDEKMNALSEKLQKVNEILRHANEKISDLQIEKEELKKQVEGEKTRGRIVIESMRNQILGAMKVGDEYLGGDVSVVGPASSTVVENREDDERVAEPGEGNRTTVLRQGKYFDPNLAKKGLGSGQKKRRRYDSGLGFLEEEDETVAGVGVELGN